MAVGVKAVNVPQFRNVNVTEGLHINSYIMIVDTMSMKEVGDAIIKSAQPIILGFISDNSPKEKAYRRIILKGGERRYDFKPLHYETDSINFYLCPYSNGKRDYKKYGLLFCMFAHFFYKGTNWYALLCGGCQTVNLYRQHFFERYIERHLKDESKVSIETVRRYFKETDYLTNCRIVENPKHKDCIYGATNIGVCCGYHCGKRMKVWLTYIDKETLSKGDKRDIFDESADALTQIGMDILGNRILKAYSSMCAYS